MQQLHQHSQKQILSTTSSIQETSFNSHNKMIAIITFKAMTSQLQLNLFCWKINGIGFISISDAWSTFGNILNLQLQNLSKLQIIILQSLRRKLKK